MQLQITAFYFFINVLPSQRKDRKFLLEFTCKKYFILEGHESSHPNHIMLVRILSITVVLKCILNNWIHQISHYCISIFPKLW